MHFELAKLKTNCLNFRTFPTLSSQNCPSENTTNYFMDNNFLTMYVVYVGVILSIS